jgi:hypothetical protein
MLKLLIIKPLKKTDWRKWLMRFMVRERGVEPLRCYPLDPKSSASASSATLATHLPYPIGGGMGRPVS